MSTPAIPFWGEALIALGFFAALVILFLGVALAFLILISSVLGGESHEEDA